MIREVSNEVNITQLSQLLNLCLLNRPDVVNKAKFNLKQQFDLISLEIDANYRFILVNKNDQLQIELKRFSLKSGFNYLFLSLRAIILEIDKEGSFELLKDFDKSRKRKCLASFSPISQAASINNPVVLREILSQDIKHKRLSSKYIKDAFDEAVSKHDAKSVAILLELASDKIDINAPLLIGDNLTALHTSVYHGNLPLVQILLQNPKINPNVRADVNNSITGFTALHMATQMGYEEVLDVLFASNKIDDNSYVTDQGITLLHLATKCNHPKLVSKLIKKGLDVNAKDMIGSTPLHIALGYGLLDPLKVLLDSDKIDVNLKDKDGCTSLHAAASNNKTEAIKVFFEARSKEINLNILEKNGLTPLHVAVQNNNVETVQALLKIPGIDVNFANKLTGFNALHYAVMDESIDMEMAKILLKVPSFDIDARDKDNLSAFHHAIIRKDNLMVSTFMKTTTKFNPNLLYNSFTPLHLAVALKDLNTVDVLLNYQVINPDTQSNRSHTPLHIAIAGRDEEMVKLLLDRKGNQIEIKDRLGFSPLLQAIVSDHVGIVRILLKEGANITNLEELGIVAPKFTIANNSVLYFKEEIRKDLIKYWNKNFKHQTKKTELLTTPQELKVRFEKLTEELGGYISKSEVYNPKAIALLLSNKKGAESEATLNSLIDEILIIIENSALLKEEMVKNLTLIFVAKMKELIADVREKKKKIGNQKSNDLSDQERDKVKNSLNKIEDGAKFITQIISTQYLELLNEKKELIENIQTLIQQEQDSVQDLLSEVKKWLINCKLVNNQIKPISEEITRTVLDSKKQESQPIPAPSFIFISAQKINQITKDEKNIIKEVLSKVEEKLTLKATVSHGRNTENPHIAKANEPLNYLTNYLICDLKVLKEIFGDKFPQAVTQKLIDQIIEVMGKNLEEPQASKTSGSHGSRIIPKIFPIATPDREEVITSEEEKDKYLKGLTDIINAITTNRNKITENAGAAL
jgi:ankyrin repeat protein